MEKLSKIIKKQGEKEFGEAIIKHFEDLGLGVYKNPISKHIYSINYP